MSFKTTIVLIVMLAVLVAAALFIKSRLATVAPAPDQTPGLAGAGKALFDEKDLSKAAVTSITIATGDKATVIARESGSWVQTQPIRYPMDGRAVDDLVSAAAKLTYSATIRPGANGDPSLEEMKLAPPQVTLTLQLEGPAGRKQILRLGRTAPSGSSGYLLRNDDPTVYLVSNALHSLLLPAGQDTDSAVKDWRIKDVPAPAAGQVDQVELTQGAATIRLQRPGNFRGHGRFRGMGYGRATVRRADADAVKALIGDAAIRVQKFVNDQAKDLGQYGLDSPTVVLSLRIPGAGIVTTTAPATSSVPPAIKTLRIGTIAGRNYGTWSDTPEPSHMVFEVSKYNAERFNKITVDTLRDPRITLAAAADVTKIAVEQNGKAAFTLERLAGPEGRWIFADPKPAFEPDSTEVSHALTAIIEARAISDRYMPDFKPKAAPLAVVKLTSSHAGVGPIPGAGVTTSAPSPTVTETLAIYPPEQPDGPAVVVRNDEAVGYSVSPERFERLTGPVLALRDRKVLDLAVNQVRSLMIGPPGRQPTVSGPVNGLISEAPLPLVLPGSPLPPISVLLDLPLVFERANIPAAPTTGPAATQPVTTRPAVSELGPWKLLGFDKFEVAALDGLIKELCTLRAERWTTAHAPARPGENDLLIQIGTSDGKSIALTLDPKTRRAYLKPDDVFEVSPAFVAAATAEFRDRTVLPIAAKDILKITVTRAGKSITLDRSEAGVYTAADGRKIDTSAVGALFDTVAGLRVDHYMAPVPERPSGTDIRIVMRDGKAHLLQLVGAGAGAEDYVRYAHVDDRWCTLPEDAVKKLGAELVAKDEPAPPAEP